MSLESQSNTGSTPLLHLPLLKYRRLSVYWRTPSRHGFQPGAPHDSACPHRHARRLAPTSAAAGDHLPSRGEPRSHSATRLSATAAHRYRAPPPPRTGLSAWSLAAYWYV